LRILVAEDSPVARELLQRMLAAWGYEAVVAQDGEQAWRLLQQPDCPRIALLDWMMPGVDGLELCRRVRDLTRDRYVYLILLTGKDQQEDVVRGLDAGADDYLKKPFDQAELLARIRAGQRIVDVHGQMSAAREALREQASTDPLTRLANRRSILQTLDREIERSRRSGAPCAIVFVDLDHFKRVNDAHGHAAGDTVLCQAAATMSGNLRPYDVLGRYGGEEFIAVLAGCDLPAARSVAERLRESIASAAVPVAGTAVNLTCSVGVAVAATEAELDSDALLGAADRALYQAKSAGRNRVVVAGEEPERGA
jgi:diguanylate cyclase (GGDEF)-like protein